MNRKHLAYDAAQPSLWIAGPGYASGTTSQAHIANIDLAPTIAALGRATEGLVVDGRTIPDVLADPGLGVDRFFPIDIAPSTAIVPHPAGTGVATSRYKYVEYDDPAAPINAELYDLLLDPFELENEIANPAYATVLASMQTLHTQAIACSGTTCRVATDPTLQLP